MSAQRRGGNEGCSRSSAGALYGRETEKVARSEMQFLWPDDRRGVNEFCDRLEL